MKRLRRMLPEWVKRPLRWVRARFRRIFPGMPTAGSLRRLQDNVERQREVTRTAQRQRDETRVQLREARAERQAAKTELFALRRDVARHGIGQNEESDSTSWWDQRIALSDGNSGVPLAHFPPGVMNPYMDLLYSRTQEFGFDPVPMHDPDVAFRLPARAVVHLHWTRVAQLGAESEEEARVFSDKFVEPFIDHVDRGGTLIWSVHEPLPHDCPYPEVEADLRQRLADISAGVHVLHPSTVEEVAPYYRLDPESVFVVEHPLYTGVYPDFVTREAARARLGVAEDTVFLVGFGAIRPYKGFERLVGLIPSLRETTGEDVRAMIAGPVSDSEDMSDLIGAARASDWVNISPHSVPDRHVQVLFRAADVVVLPYRYIHNSGVMMLGLTFGAHCVAPDNAVTRDAASSGLVHPFDASSDADLQRVLVEAIASRAAAGTPGDDFLARHDPHAIGADFGRALTEIARR